MKIRKITTILAVISFFFNSFVLPDHGFADLIVFPKPGQQVALSLPFAALTLKGMKVNPENPMQFEFILDKGDYQEKQGYPISRDIEQLVKFFLTSLTVPDQDLWVNLSPYEKDRIIPESFGQTQMGRDLLAEDYILKQVTASLIYPEGETGKKFWTKVYTEAADKFGTTNVPVNTFNKVWIVPEKASVYEHVTRQGSTSVSAYVVDSKLKVMLEQDYLSLSKHQAQATDNAAIGSQIVRDIVIPQLNKEVNEGKNFALLRQVYNSLILATWYKKKIKDSLLKEVFVNQNKIAGVNANDPKEKQRIYQLYLQAFKKGVFNYIKEERDPLTNQMVPRKYFSGGVSYGNIAQVEDEAMTVDRRDFLKLGTGLVTAGVTLAVAPRIASAGPAASRTAPAPRILTSSQQALVNQYLGLFPVDPNGTGLTVSHYDPTNGPQNYIEQYGSDAYDTATRIMLAPNSLARTIIQTYLNGPTTVIASAGNPQTQDFNYTDGLGNYNHGLFEIVRYTGFDVPYWYTSWDFGVNIGASAWVGLAMLNRINDFPDLAPQIMQFVQARVASILDLQEADGRVRYGPKGQYYASVSTSQFTLQFGQEEGLRIYRDLVKTGALIPDGKAADGTPKAQLNSKMMNWYHQKRLLRRRENFQPQGALREYLAQHSMESAGIAALLTRDTVVDLNYYYNTVSTEKDISSLLFIDSVLNVYANNPLAGTPSDPNFLTNTKTAADNIYNFLITQMYQPNLNMFYKGTHQQPDGTWLNDTNFAIDCSFNWVPIARMMNDTRVADTPLHALFQLQQFLQAAINPQNLNNNNVGVFDGNGNLLGLSFTPQSQANNIITLEQSWQFVNRVQLITNLLQTLSNDPTTSSADQTTALQYVAQNQQLLQGLTANLNAYYTTDTNGNTYAPYAVFSGGAPALSQDTGNGYLTPQYSIGSVISSTYSLFVQFNIDPVAVLTGLPPASTASAAMTNSRHLATPQARITAPDKTGGIDLKSDKINLQVQQGETVDFKVNRAMMAQLQDAPGFIPLVTKVQIGANLDSFLGLK